MCEFVESFALNSLGALGLQPTNRIQSRDKPRDKNAARFRAIRHIGRPWLGRPAGRATHGTRVAQDFPRWQRWKIFGKWLGKCLVKGWFKVSLGMCICLCLSTYSYIHIIKCSSNKFRLGKCKNNQNWEMKKMEKVLIHQKQKKCEPEKSKLGLFFSVSCISSVFVDFYSFFHYCFFPLFHPFSRCSSILNCFTKKKQKCAQPKK